MRASEFSANHFTGRATSGQMLDIRYDPSTNAIIFFESDWAKDVRGAVSPRTTFREQLERHPGRKGAEREVQERQRGSWGGHRRGGVERPIGRELGASSSHPVQGEPA